MRYVLHQPWLAKQPASASYACSIADNPLRFVLAEMCGHRPSLCLPDIAYVA